MKFIFSPKQVEGGQQPGEPEIVVAVKVADEDMADPLKMNMEPPDLELGPFGAVYQQQALIGVEQMSAWASHQRRQG